MMNCHRFFPLALLIVSILFTNPALAEDASEIKPKQIAVGSSEYVWAIDASDNTLLYRRNPNTFRYDKVTSNIAVDALDVSLDGVALALSGKKLYLWDDASQSFKPQGSSQQFDQVAIGDAAVWGLEGQTAYRWDNDNIAFVQAPGAFKTLTVGKEDDSVWGIGSDGQLYQWDATLESWNTFAINISGSIQLSARSKNALWALLGNSTLYQWNPLANRFVDQSGKFPQAFSLAQFALDSQKIIYGVSNSRLVFYDIERFAVEMDGTREASGPVSTIDSQGRQHIVYNQGGGVYHSYAQAGAGGGWIEAKPVSQSGGGTNLNLAADNAGNVHASWISGAGNDKEIYYAVGKPNAQFGGYDWSDAAAVSDDNVADDGLTMVLGPRGRPIFFSTKVDVKAAYADRDIYHHTLDLDANPLTYDGVISFLPRQNDGSVFEIDPLGSFLRAGATANLQGSSNFGLTLTPMGAASYTWKFKDEMFKLTFTVEFLRVGSRSGKMTYEPGLGGTLLIKLGEWAKELFGYELEIEAFLELSADARYITAIDGSVSQALIKGDLDLLIEIPVYGNKADPALDRVTAAAQKAGIKATWKISVVVGARLLVLDFLWDPSSEEGGEDPETVCAVPYEPETGLKASSLSLPSFLKITDKYGKPPRENTPDANMRMHFDTDAFANYLYSKFFTFGSGLGETESEFASHFGPGVGMKFEAKEGGGSESIDAEGEMLFWFLFDVSGNGNKDMIYRQQFLIKVKIGPWAWTVLNAIFTEHGTQATAPTAAFSPGGTTTAHGERPLLGDGGGTNILDEGAISTVIVGSNAYGAFTQETGDSTFQAVYVITGQVDPNDDIIWDPNTVYMIPKSGGFNSDPLLAAHYNPATQQDDQIMVTWGGAPAASNDLVDSLANTPPGKVFVAYGHDITNVTLDLGEFTADPNAASGYFLSNDLALFAIGSSVSQLGDVDGKGKSDFIFGAPDAEIEKGRAYVVFGEQYDQATDIENLKGSLGFVMAGDPDSELGYAVGSAGDFNGDGKPDLLVSAPGANNHQGAVYVLYGGSSLTGTSGIVDAANNNLPGLALIGADDGERLGTAIGAGLDSSGLPLDVTDDELGDIVVGASGANAVYIYTDANDPASRLKLIYGDQDSGGNPAFPLGADVAVIPSMNGDSLAEVLIGSNGTAFLLYGGEDLQCQSRDYSVSWKKSGLDKEGNAADWQAAMTFSGNDRDNDGVLRGRCKSGSFDNYKNELEHWTMSVFLNEKKVAYYADDDDGHPEGDDDPDNFTRTDFNFNFQLDGQQVLASGDAGDPNGLNAGFPATGSKYYDFHTDGTCLTLSAYVDEAAEVVAAADKGDDLFTLLSEEGAYDLATMNDVPGMGVQLNTYAAQPLSVAAAGDVNDDGYGDYVVGYGETSDPDTGDPIPGKSFLLYGSAGDTLGGVIQLEDIENYNQGVIFDQAGGAVQAAGDFNGDGIDDLVIGAPAAVSSTTRAYLFYGQKNGNPIAGPQFSDVETLSLSGAALAPAGDLNGDGKSDLLIGAPYMADTNILSSLQGETQIQYAALPLGPGGGEATHFERTQAEGVGPMAIGRTGRGSLLTWVEPNPDSTYTLYGSFWTGSAWGNPLTVRQSSNAISDVSITDPNNASPGATSVPTVVWQESDDDRANQPSLWQGTYDNTMQEWSKTLFQPAPATAPPGPPTNDESNLVVEDSEYSVEDVSALESGGHAVFEIKRTGGRQAHTLRYYTVDITAAAGLDYTHSEGVLKFAKGEASKTIRVPVHADKAREHRGERVLLVLESDHPRAYRTRGGLRRSGAPRITAELLLGDSAGDKTVDLTALDSGFITAGDTAVSFGGAVSSAGDINGDGYDDFLAGASGVSDHKGALYLIYGKEGIELKDMEIYLPSMSADEGVALTASADSISAGAAVVSGTAGGKRFIAIGAPGNASKAGKVYVVTADMLPKGTTKLNLDTESFAIHTFANTPGNRFGAALAVGDVDNNGEDDLVIVAPGPNGTANPGQVYLVYDGLLATAAAKTSTIKSGDLNVDVISNSAGTGFGHAAAVGDFSADGKNDLVLGSTRGETLYDKLGAVRGYGGQIFAIWGKSGRPGSIDVGNLGSAGAIFAGQAEFSPQKASPSADPGTGAPTDNKAASFALTDGIGDAAAMVDLNGDGYQDLAIGAPSAFIPSPDGSYDVANLLAGRVYVLFGSSAWKQERSYDLMNLYGDGYQKGIVLEGSLGRGRAGASLANAGFFRGSVDSQTGLQDLLIGAPAANADAGQAYLIFGSANRYTTYVNSAGENILKLDPFKDPANPGVALLFGYQGITNPLTSANPSNSGKVGHSVAGAGDINGDGADDILIGAPTASVNDLGQAYIPIGHPWITPGQSLNVKDLRSDNGFVLQVPGPPAPVGDVNGDGYDDVVMLGESPELVLGASALANVNGVRQFQLLQSQGGYQVTWPNRSSAYIVVIDFDGADLDGDGILRGRGTDPASVAQGSGNVTFGNELTNFVMQVYQGSELAYTIALAQQLQRSDFNFNFDLLRQEVIGEDNWSTAHGVNAGIYSGSEALWNFYSNNAKNDIELNQKVGNNWQVVAATPYGSQYFKLTRRPAVPGTQQRIYRAIWTGQHSSWSVELWFAGSDRNGDGYIRCRGNGNTIDQAANELTLFTMNVKQSGDTKATYTLNDLLNRNDLNLNFWVSHQQVRASEGYHDPDKGLNLGLYSSTDYNFTTHSSNDELKLTYNKDNKKENYSDQRADSLFQVASGPLATYGPLVAGDFNGDAYEDFILFTNLGTLHGMALPLVSAESRPAYIFYGNADAGSAVSQVVTQAVPLTYISGAKTGDINGDGYHDLVLSGYNYNISNAATAPDKSYLLAYYGSADPFDLGAPGKILYTESSNVSRYVLALLDITNNGQDDIVTYTLKRAGANFPPFPYITQADGQASLNQIENLYTYGSTDVGGTPGWYGPISLTESVFSKTSTKYIVGLAAGRQVDIDNDGLLDLIFTMQEAGSRPLSEGPESTGYILHSTGAFTFQDGNGNWKTSIIEYPFQDNGIELAELSLYVHNPQAAVFQTRISGVRDFNLDGIDDILVTADSPEDQNGKAVYSYLIYGSADLPGSYLGSLKYQDDTFAPGIPIKGLQWLQAPYAASDAGDLNGDGFGDIMMSDATTGLSYGLYGYLPAADTLQTVDYITGSDDNDVLQQVESSVQLVNVTGKGGDDFIQTMLIPQSGGNPYQLVLYGGPGDDQIGIATLNGASIVRIDGGNGFDELFMNPSFDVGFETLYLNQVGRRITSIELMDLGTNNSIEFSFLNVRNLSETSNTLMLRGSSSSARPVHGNNWKFLGQSSHDGVLYNVYEYLPEGNQANAGKSDIQVWIEDGGVSWNPLGQ